jgi:hypothetical protein
VFVSGGSGEFDSLDVNGFGDPAELLQSLAAMEAGCRVIRVAIHAFTKCTDSCMSQPVPLLVLRAEVAWLLAKSTAV